MAINPETLYPGKVAPSSASYPYGEARNVTTPGDGTGTPWDAAFVNDLFALIQSILDASGQVPTGTPDAVGNGQVFLGLNAVCASVAVAKAGNLAVGQRVLTKGYYAAGDGGAAIYLVTAPQSTDGVVDHDLANGNALLIEPGNGAINMFQAGCVADGTTVGGTNNSPLVNAAIQWVRDNPSRGNTVLGSIGEFSIEEPIVYLQAVHFYASGTLDGSVGGTEFICNFSAPTIASPPVDNETGRYSPVLAWTPMIYNTELLTQARFGGFKFNANDKDVYGVYFNEYYFMRFDPVTVIRANKAPVTFVVGQFNYWEQLNIASNLGTSRFIGTDTGIINLLDTEANTVTGSMIDFIHDASFSTKSGVVINAWHYEETDVLFPTILAQVSGRGFSCQTASFGMSAVPALRYIEHLGSEAYTFDGVSITTAPAIGAEFEAISFSTAKGAVKFKAGAVGCYAKTTSTSVDDDSSGNVTNITEAMSGAPVLPRGAEVRNSTGGKMLSFPDDNTANFYNTANRNLRASGADWIVENLGGRLEVNASADVFIDAGTGSVDIDVAGGNSGQFDDNATADESRFLVADSAGTLQRVKIDNGAGPVGVAGALYV
ncbi:hypothetical protein K0U83_18730 [bacterium]|nr:hypothetical protein [bacterium]